MKKRTILGMALAAAGAAGWYVTANRRRDQVEALRSQVRSMLAVRRGELQALRSAAGVGELTAEPLSAQPLEGLQGESVRLENGVLTICRDNGQTKAWLSDHPLEELEVHTRPWRGSAHPGVLYTESLGDGWYAGYACLHWS